MACTSLHRLTVLTVRPEDQCSLNEQTYCREGQNRAVLLFIEHTDTDTLLYAITLSRSHTLVYRVLSVICHIVKQHSTGYCIPMSCSSSHHNSDNRQRKAVWYKYSVMYLFLFVIINHFQENQYFDFEWYSLSRKCSLFY